MTLFCMGAVTTGSGSEFQILIFHIVVEGLLKLSYCWMGRESWHAIKKLFNLPFLTLKVRYPAIS